MWVCSFPGGVEFLEAINPEAGFRWLSFQWHPDTSKFACDSDGWQYSGIRWDSEWAGKYNKMLHYTRRRRLIRTSESETATGVFHESDSQTA